MEMFCYHIFTDGRHFDYKPSYWVDDFIRNNDLSELEINDMARIKNVMVELYKTWLDENYSDNYLDNN